MAHGVCRSAASILRSADLILHTGDFSSGAVIDDLSRYGPLVGVHGTMDDGEVRARLPERVVAEHAGLWIGVVHDAGRRVGRHERLLAWFPDCDLIAYGHTHSPEVTLVGGRWIVNPGSPTERRRSPSHTMVVVEGGVPRLVEL